MRIALNIAATVATLAFASRPAMTTARDILDGEPVKLWAPYAVESTIETAAILLAIWSRP